jgi:hypothetical protein
MSLQQVTSQSVEMAVGQKHQAHTVSSLPLVPLYHRCENSTLQRPASRCTPASTLSTVPKAAGTSSLAITVDYSCPAASLRRSSYLVMHRSWWPVRELFRNLSLHSLGRPPKYHGLQPCGARLSCFQCAAVHDPRYSGHTTARILTDILVDFMRLLSHSLHRIGTLYRALTCRASHPR